MPAQDRGIYNVILLAVPNSLSGPFAEAFSERSPQQSLAARKTRAIAKLAQRLAGHGSPATQLERESRSDSRRRRWVRDVWVGMEVVRRR
jgi:hypothetical protein